MNTLIIYDTTGYIIQKITGSYRVPVGVPYLEIEIPEGKRIKDGIGVDTTVTPHQVILENIPKTQEQILAQTVADLTLQNADLGNQVQTLSQTIAQMQLG